MKGSGDCSTWLASVGKWSTYWKEPDGRSTTGRGLVNGIFIGKGMEIGTLLERLGNQSTCWKEPCARSTIGKDLVIGRLSEGDWGLKHYPEYLGTASPIGNGLVIGVLLERIW